MSSRYQSIREGLLREAERGEMFHAYLFEGPPGSRKKELVLELAQVLLQRENPQVCSDFFLLEKNEMKMENLRKMIADSFVEPFSKKKIYLIEEAEQMSVAMQNALLKTLEEPPSYLIFFLLCANPESLLPTLRSRCLHYYLPAEGRETFEELLPEDEKRMADFFSAISRKEALQIMRAIDELKTAKERSEDLLQVMLRNCSALIRAKESGKEVFFAGGFSGELAENCKRMLTGFELLQIIDIIEGARKKIGSRCAPGVVFEVLLFDILEVLGCQK